MPTARSTPALAATSALVLFTNPRQCRSVRPLFRPEHDSTEYVDWSKAKRGVFPNLKLSTKTISLRLPESMLEELKLLANKNDVTYQSLVKVFLSERIESELQKHGPQKIKR